MDDNTGAPMRNERVPDQWQRDARVLRATVNWFTRVDDEPISYRQLATMCDLPAEEVTASLRNLSRGRYIEGAANERLASHHVFGITERALRETGAWPNAESEADRLLWVLERKVEEAATPEDRNRWTRIRDAFGGAGRDFAVEVAAAMATRSMGS